MGFFWKRGKTIEEEYREALRLAVQTFENFPDLSLDFSDRQVNKIIIPRLKKLIKTELAMDSKNQSQMGNPRVELLKIILNSENPPKDRNQVWEQLKKEVIHKWNSLPN